MMVVGRRITKGGKTNKMGSKTTGDAWNHYPNKTGSDNNRHQGNRERGKTWQEAFLVSLLCTSSVLPTVTRESYSVRLSEGERSLAGEALIDHMHTQVYSLRKCFYIWCMKELGHQENIQISPGGEIFLCIQKLFWLPCFLCWWEGYGEDKRRGIKYPQTFLVFTNIQKLHAYNRISTSMFAAELSYRFQSRFLWALGHSLITLPNKFTPDVK